MRRWAVKNNVELCFTPTNASWANPIEAHFGPLRQFTLANSNHPNHPVQTRELHRYLRWRNQNVRHPDVLAAQRRERCPHPQREAHPLGRPPPSPTPPDHNPANLRGQSTRQIDLPMGAFPRRNSGPLRPARRARAVRGGPRPYSGAASPPCGRFRSPSSPVSCGLLPRPYGRRSTRTPGCGPWRRCGSSRRGSPGGRPGCPAPNRLGGRGVGRAGRALRGSGRGGPGRPEIGDPPHG
jgi:hypothetical protein